MTEGTTLQSWTGSGAGPTMATESVTIATVPVTLEQIKLVFGDLGSFTGAQGGRTVDGSSTIAAGFVDPRMDGKDTSVNPTISTSAYSAGQCIGAVLDFGAMARANNGGVLITSATLIDTSNQKQTIVLFLFNQNPTNGTYTDHATPTANATDMSYVRGFIPFGTYSSISTMGASSIPNVGLHIVCGGSQTHLYGVAIIAGAATYGSTAVTFALEYIPD